MSTVHSSIDHHPDLLALRERYERAAESMTAHGTFGLTLLTAVYAAVSPWGVGSQPRHDMDAAGLRSMVHRLALGALPRLAARRHDLVECDRGCGADGAGLERDVLRYARA